MYVFYYFDTRQNQYSMIAVDALTSKMNLYRAHEHTLFALK